MDRAWAVEQLRDFVGKIDKLEELEDDDARRRVGHPNAGVAKRLEDELVSLLPSVRILLDAAAHGLGERAYNARYHSDRDRWEGRWSGTKAFALEAIGLHTLGTEAKERMRPDAPDLAADQLHVWVWEAARPLWEGGSHQDAVQTAARSINARLQQKLGRRDIAEAPLCREAFTPKDPEPGKPRLRFAGDRISETWRTRQVGALDFGAGCFEGIRNPAAHQHRLDLPEQVALEQLAALSVLARWIDECAVEGAAPGGGSQPRRSTSASTAAAGRG